MQLNVTDVSVGVQFRVWSGRPWNRAFDTGQRRGFVSPPQRSNNFFFFWRNSPQCAMAPSFTRFLDHTQRRTSQYDSSVRVISPTQRPLLDSTQHTHTHTHTHTHETDIHVPRWDSNPQSQQASDCSPTP